jgi:hypothetical protein
MFAHDVRARDWRDDDALHFHEADRSCFTCEKAIPRGVLCPECGIALDEGGEG